MSKFRTFGKSDDYEAPTNRRRQRHSFSGWFATASPRRRQRTCQLARITWASTDERRPPRHTSGPSVNSCSAHHRRRSTETWFQFAAWRTTTTTVTTMNISASYLRVSRGKHPSASGSFAMALSPNSIRRLPRNFPGFGEVGVMEFELKGTSRVCRGRHRKVGMVEFGLYMARPLHETPLHAFTIVIINGISEHTRRACFHGLLQLVRISYIHIHTFLFVLFYPRQKVL